MISSHVTTVALNLARVWLIRLIAFLVVPFLTLAIFGQQQTLVLPSHPSVDENGNGIDDFEESSGTYSDPEEKAGVYGVTFPIAELENCANFSECMTFCEDPVNYTACSDFAKQKGFWQEDKTLTNIDELYRQAKEELGCDSATACLDYCQQITNFDACDVFTKKLETIGGYIEDPNQEDILAKAKEILGCDSYEACLSYCNDPANSQKCADFASETGLVGGSVPVGPGGCTTDTTCQSFCADPNNFSECSQFAPPNTNFTGPGGCDSPSACRTHCEENPNDCRSYAPGSNGVYVTVACPPGQYHGPGGVCTPNEKSQEAGNCVSGSKFWDGNSCQDTPPPGVYTGSGSAYFQPRDDMGGCKTPGECYDYCKANSGSCGGFNQDSARPNDTYTPSLYYTPGTIVKFDPKADYGNCSTPTECYDWCKSNAGGCQGFDGNSPRPSDQYTPGTYYTPPSDYVYYTPPATSYYVTPIYYTPPEGSDYQTPSYYTPGSYYTPSYYTPSGDYNYQTHSYATPSYYTPYYYTPSYYTPSGNYTTPSYYTPQYYTPPEGTNYYTPTYYSPNYYTPSYTTPTYYTPYDSSYQTPSYYTPGYSYPTPSGSYSYPTPSGSYSYPSPSYSYPTPSESYSYPSPSYGTPSYGTPTYETPSYGTPSYGTPTYETPSYSTPSSSRGRVAGAKIGPVDRVLLFLGRIFGF